MLKWLKKAALWALGKDGKSKKSKRDKLAPNVRTQRIIKKLEQSGMTEEDIERLTGARKALARKARGK